MKFERAVRSIAFSWFAYFIGMFVIVVAVAEIGYHLYGWPHRMPIRVVFIDAAIGSIIGLFVGAKNAWLNRQI